MKAILIDPFTKTVCELQTSGAYDAIKRLVFVDLLDRSEYLEAVNIGAGHCMYIDEEGLLVPWDEQAFFEIGLPSNCRQIAGRAVICKSTDDGDNADCELPVSIVVQTVRWISAQAVSVAAPVLTTVGKDGDIKRELLHGVERWDYLHQPPPRRRDE